MRSLSHGTTSVPGFLDDHAFLGLACLALHQATLAPAWLERALELSDEVVRLFAAPDGTRLFLTGADVAAPLGRPVDGGGLALPSATSAGAELLWRTGRLTGDRTRCELAHRTLGPLLRQAAERPEEHAHALTVLALMRRPPRDIALLGDGATAAARALAAAIGRTYCPEAVVAASPVHDARVALLDDRWPVNGRATAYVCEGMQCLRPTSEPDVLAEQLRSARERPSGPRPRRARGVEGAARRGAPHPGRRRPAAAHEGPRLGPRPRRAPPARARTHPRARPHARHHAARRSRDRRPRRRPGRRRGPRRGRAIHSHGDRDGPGRRRGRGSLPPDLRDRARRGWRQHPANRQPRRDLRPPRADPRLRRANRHPRTRRMRGHGDRRRVRARAQESRDRGGRRQHRARGGDRLRARGDLKDAVDRRQVGTPVPLSAAECARVGRGGEEHDAFFTHVWAHYAALDPAG